MSCSDNSWIGANEALRRANSYLGDEWEAKSELRRRAKSGRIRTTGVVRGQVQPLDAIFWTNWPHADGRSGAAFEEWVHGAFEGRSLGSPIIRASNVRFNVSDIDRYYPSNMVKRGRPPANWWADAAEELALLIHEEGAPDRVEQLIDQLLERLAARDIHPSRSAIQPLASRVMSRVRAI